MLQRLAPTLFQGTTGETVTIAAVAQSNNGVEAATFRYGTTQLTPRQVQGHPGCEFNVVAGTNTFGALVVFDPASPNARYELFEEDDSGILQPLQIIARPLSGPIVQFQVAAIAALAPVTLPPPPAAVESASQKVAKKAAKKAVKKTARKAATKATKAAKKTVKKASKKTSRAAAKSVRRATGKVTKKAAKATKKMRKRGTR